VSIAVALGLLSLAAWLVLLLMRGTFWWPRVPPAIREPARWPSVCAIVPARDEAALIEQSMASLLGQDYPGAFSVVLVDDHSSDGTAEIADRLQGSSHLRIVRAPPLPLGWTGKLSAMNRGVQEAGNAELILFTDADIWHHPTNLREMVARLERENRDLLSLMVKLHCESIFERLLIPAFVFFFAMLYPFRWVRDSRRKTAAAAGGCMLIRSRALERIGGIAAIKGALIDDCALARAVKDTGGSLRLDLTNAAASIRPYPSLGSIWNMIVRSAFAQLRYSPSLLAGTIIGMAIIYLLPPVLLVTDVYVARWLGLAGWAITSLAYVPMVRFYRQSPVWAILLPVTTLIYLGATIASAWRHYRGHGGSWKGRVEWRSVR
jgi:hopene-associated glycosyltransferase HpnB